MNDVKGYEEQIVVKRGELREIMEKIQSNSSLRSANDASLGDLRRNIANINYVIY